MRTLVPVRNGDILAAVRGFLRQLLEAGVVSALMVPMETSAGTVTPALVADPDLLDSADPLAPVMGLNAARVAAHCSTGGHPSASDSGHRVGVVLRSCELRALVELVKVKQANLEDIVTIGVDCLGTYDMPVYESVRAGEGLDVEAQLEVAQSGEALPWTAPCPEKESTTQGGPEPACALRDACEMCEKPHIEEADITVELFGYDPADGLPVSLSDDLAGVLDVSPVEGRARRAEVVERLVAARTAVRNARLAEIEEQLQRDGLHTVFAACVGCHNCMSVCPMCYCRTCLFRNPVFEHEPMQYLNWAQQKGACRLPTDTMLFHWTRLSHMALSCVGCGMCTSACPAELPVGRVFRAIARRLQGLFEYVPGRDVEEPLPMVTFREDEWTEIGEE
jgi:formate dehydrogenase subunit beta